MKYWINNFLLLSIVLALSDGLKAQSNLDTLLQNTEENISLKKLASDSNSTCFLIAIKESVKNHYHKNHTESIYVIDGNAKMWLNGDTILIKKGDYINIPPQTRHGVIVTSEKALRVLSVQAPEFKGFDRYFE